MHDEFGYLLVFSIATAVAIAARHFRFPYTVALVLTGLALGVVTAFEPPHLTKELLFAVILPGLLFEAAYHVDFKSFRANHLAIQSLAVPGVVASIAATALFLAPVFFLLQPVEGFHFIHALMFAAIIVATDPIAVVGLFRTLGAPKRLSILVEGESLLNDGTGVVLYGLILGVALGQPFSLGRAVLDFVTIAGMGAVTGGLLGYAISRVIARVDDAMVEITLTVIAAYGSFVIAEHFHFSGVIATVVAGMFCGNLAARHGMSPTTRVAVASFWEYVSFALNSVVFLLIGAEVKVAELLHSWLPILVAYVAVLLGRAVVVFGVTSLLKLTRERLPATFAKVITWAGLRGAVSMVLALSLPDDFTHRELLLHMTFGVVLLSIVVQGLTMAPLLRRLGVTGVKDKYQVLYERARGRLGAKHAALAALAKMRESREIPAEVLSPLEHDYREHIAGLEAELAGLKAQTTRFQEEEQQEAVRRALVVEKDALRHALAQGAIGQDAHEHLVAEINERLDRAQAEEVDPAAAPPATKAASEG